MTGSIGTLLLATTCFVGGHFILSSALPRHYLMSGLGENGFRLVYSIVAIGALIWTIAAYRAAPYEEIWAAGMTFRHLPAVLMPFASILAVAGLTSRNVTVVGGESLAGDPRPVKGIVTITRHPFLWGVTLWSAGHILANGNLASLILFGGLALLALGGMAHIDYRRRVALGSDWGPVAMTTSAIPFLAAIQGRHDIDWRGIGWVRVVAGLVVYVLLIVLHPWLSGVTIAPAYLLNLVP